MPSYAALDRLHARVVRVPALRYLTAVTRVLLAVGFIPSGATKILDRRFTSLPVSHPVGFFFEAFHQTGIWYQFVGLAQVLAAVLLLIPRTAALGAVLYLPIIVNVMLVTIGVGFRGTPVVTVPMTLGALYLVCWDYDRWRALLPRLGGGAASSPFARSLYARSAAAWAVAGAAAYGVAYALGLGNVDRGLGLAGFGLLAAAGAGFGLATAWHARRVEPPIAARADG